MVYIAEMAGDAWRTTSLSGRHETSPDQTDTSPTPAQQEPSSDNHGEVLSNENFPTLSDASTSSSDRKEQVRTALFHKTVPARVGRYVLLERLGVGSVGEIYA